MKKVFSASDLQLSHHVKESERNDTTSSETASTHSRSSSYLNAEEEDYGFFDPEFTSLSVSSFDADLYSLEPAAPSSSQISTDYNSARFEECVRRLFEKKDGLGDARVLFLYSNKQSSIICRSFSSKFFDYQSIQVSLNGFRIVQYPSGVRVDYEIAVEINGVLIKLWKRYTEFEAFAHFLGESSETLSETQTSWFHLVSTKPWFRNLSVPYLIKKMLRLEHFLRCAMFELRSPIPFLSFLA